MKLSKLSFTREPVLWAHFVSAVVGVVAAFTTGLSGEQTAALMAVLQAFAAIVSRQRVTPSR